jgi:hypothetical protein
MPAHEHTPSTRHPVTDATPTARLRVTRLPSFVVCSQCGAVDDRASPPGWVIAASTSCGVCPGCLAALATPPEAGAG